MNTLSTTTETPDELDRLFADFFKSQLKQPWPTAPVAPVAAQLPSRTAEPSELAAARAADAPRRQPAPARRDTTARARLTLAASVALMLGTCWYLSDGFQPGARPSLPLHGSNTGAPMLPGSSANGDTHEPLQKIGEDKAKGNGGITVDAGQFE